MHNKNNSKTVSFIQGLRPFSSSIPKNLKKPNQPHDHAPGKWTKILECKNRESRKCILTTGAVIDDAVKMQKKEARREGEKAEKKRRTSWEGKRIQDRSQEASKERWKNGKHQDGQKVATRGPNYP